MKKSPLLIIGLIIFFLMDGVVKNKLMAQAKSSSPVLVSNAETIGGYQGKIVSLANLLKTLEQNFDATFLFKDKVVQHKWVNTDKIQMGKNTGQQLANILEQLNLTYYQLDEQTYVLLLKKNTFKKSNTQEQISGTVTDAQTGETLPGVNILVKGTSTGASTNANGQYELTVESLQDTLVVSYIGYQTKEIAIAGRTRIDVALQSQAISGEEMVVIGYGEQKKENLTGSVQSVNGQELAEQPAIQTSSALQGKAPGVTVTENSGQPGEDQGSIRIRGIGTLGGSAKNDPLILIDGVEGDIDNVAASDIKNISVLKDASSAAIYGSRAANGVILITTKRGQSGKIQVHYNGRLGLKKATGQPQYVDGGTYMRLNNLGNENLGQQPVWSQEYIDGWEADHATNPNKYPNTDWVDAVFSEPASQTQHELDVSGGSEDVQYHGSLEYDNQTAEVPNYQFQRYSIRLNTDIKASDKIKFKFDANALRNDQEQPSSVLNLITRQAYRMAPIYTAKFSNGQLGPGRQGLNPLGLAKFGGLNQTETSIFRGRLQGQYDPISSLSLKLTYAPEYRSLLQKDVTKLFRSYDPKSGDLLSTYPSRNSLSENYARDFTNNVNLTATYEQDFNAHSLKVLGGYELIDFRTDYFKASRDNFALQDFEQLNAGSENNQQNGGSAAEHTLESVFGRINYAYKDKYLLEANLRYDGSSRFTEQKRWGVFPSFSAGWRISEESFMHPLHFISSLKIRGSWGKLGNQEIGNYPFAAVASFGQNYLFGGGVANGAAQLDLANQDISWEKTTTTDVGIDLSLYESRFNLTFDWFKRSTNDILLQLPIPLIIGLNAPFQNAGSVDNTGWEMELGYDGNIGSGFNYSASFNISGINNKVTNLKGAGPFIGDNTITKEGAPINSIYGYEANGLFGSQEEIDNYAKQTGQIAPGDIKYVDQNTVDTNGDGILDAGDGTINADDRVIIGNPFPDLTYGLNISAKYKNVDFSALLQGVGSRDVLLQWDAVWAFYNAGSITKWQANDYWRPEKPDNDYPRLTATTNHSNFQTSSYWVNDASYLRLRNLQVGYTIPANWSNKISVSKLRIYFVGQNLFTWFDNLPPGIDPNVPNNTTGAFFPVQKLYSLGIDIKF